MWEFTGSFFVTNFQRHCLVVKGDDPDPLKSVETLAPVPPFGGFSQPTLSRNPNRRVSLSSGRCSGESQHREGHGDS